MNIGKVLLKSLRRVRKTVGLQSATLIRVAPGTRTPGALSGGTNPTTTGIPCQALIELLSDDDVPATLIQQNDRKIGILGASLPSGIVPSSNDRVTMTDLDGAVKTFRLFAVISGDGVRAVFEFQARV